MKVNKQNNYSDVILIGTGIMSATLGTFLKKLAPDWSINVFERMDKVAMESSEAWNNAGTGHSAFCELNYTTEKEDGSMDIKKAIKIAESYEVSKEFWSTLTNEGIINPANIIKHTPHLSFVWGDDNVDFLRKRYAAMSVHPLFKGMEFSDNFDDIASWIPLVMEGRDPSVKVAATRMDIGTDVNFGTLSRAMMDYLQQDDNVELRLHHEVENIERRADGLWELTIKDMDSGEEKTYSAQFVFIFGAICLHWCGRRLIAVA